MNTPTIQYFKPSDTVVSKTNVRPGSKANNVDNLANDIAHNGQLQPVVIRLENDVPAVVAGQRRRKALLRLEQEKNDVQLAGIVVDIDDAQATAISLSENHQQEPMSPIDAYKAFVALVKQGWDTETIAQVYSMRTLEVRQLLAIGALPVAVTKAYEGDHIDGDCLKVLAIADKTRVRKWVALFKKGEAPTWPQGIRSFLANDKRVIETSLALFDVNKASIAVVEDFFENAEFFADSDEFWALQEIEIQRLQNELEANQWCVEIRRETFYNWEYTEVAKKSGGKAYIFVEDSGRVTVKKGLLTNTAYRALKNPTVVQGGEASDKPKEKPEVTQKLRDYLLGYLTQSARTSVTQDYDLTQRALLCMLLTGDGLFNMGYDDQFARVDEQLTAGQLFASDQYKECNNFQKAALKKIGSKPGESHYTGDFKKLSNKVMSLEIGDVQTIIQALVVSGITLNSQVTLEINRQIQPTMSDFWNSDKHCAFFDVVTGKPLLLAILESLTNKKTAAEHVNSKVVDIRELVKTEAGSHKKWTPDYLTGGNYGNGVGAPLN